MCVCVYIYTDIISGMTGAGLQLSLKDSGNERGLRQHVLENGASVPGRQENCILLGTLQTHRYTHVVLL